MARARWLIRQTGQTGLDSRIHSVSTGWPTFYADHPSGTRFFGFDSDNRHNQALTGGVLENNTTWIKGQHSMQFGGKIRKEWNNVRELQQAQGSHNFGCAWTALYNPDG